MSDYTIFHNPRCSKSRQTLALLEDAGVKPTVIEYLKTPPTVGQLGAALTALDRSATDIIRFKESEAEGLSANDARSADEWLALIAATPKLLERPIVVRSRSGHPDDAVIGRPPDNVQLLLDGE